MDIEDLLDEHMQALDQGYTPKTYHDLLRLSVRHNGGLAQLATPGVMAELLGFDSTLRHSSA